MHLAREKGLPHAPTRVLLIEDNPVDCRVVRRMLQRASDLYDLTIADSCAEGLRLIGERQFDCVLLDLHLADGSGAEVLLALEHSGSSYPVVILTGSNASDQERLGALRLGAQDFLEKYHLTSAQLIRAMDSAMERHNRLRTMEEDRKTLEWLATQDPLTGLLNRRGLERAIERLHAGMTEDDTLPFHVLLVDCDDFKSVNSLYGHAAGDRALQSIARELHTHVRASDLVARIGGDELMVLLNQKDLARALNTAERLRHAIANTVTTWESHDFTVSVSIGVAPYPKGIHSSTTLLEITQAALQESKGAGKDCVHAATGTPTKEVQAQSFEECLHEQLSRAEPFGGEIHVHTPCPMLQAMDPQHCLNTVSPELRRRMVLRIPAHSMGQPQTLERRLAPLRSAGVSVELELDSPGDLGHLLHFLPDRIHVPDHMIDGVSRHAESRQVLERLIQIAGNLGVQVTGELANDQSDQALIDDLGVSTPLPLASAQLTRKASC